MNTTILNIIEEDIRKGSTQIEFKVVAESSTLLAILIQEAFLHKQNKKTLEEEDYIDLSEHLFLSAEKLKESPHFKGIDIDVGLGRLVVTRSRFSKEIKEFALKRFKKMKKLLKEQKNNPPEIVDEDPLGCNGELSPEEAATQIENINQTDNKSLEQIKEEFMTRINVKQKGGDGERHVIKLLQPVIDEVFMQADELDQNDIPILNRNLDQVRDGGHDIIGVDFLAIEVKNVATLNLNKWFEQAKEQAGEGQEPVLIYKVKGKWRVMMFGLIPCGTKHVRTNVDIDMSAFIVWFRGMIQQMLGIAL